jgi:PAS domain S-box-containing protein
MAADNEHRSNSRSTPAQNPTQQAPSPTKERYHLMFEQAAIGIAFIGIDGGWLETNQKLCAILGYTNEELLGQTWQDSTYPDDLAQTLASMSHLLQDEQKAYTTETRYLHKDGTLIWTNLTISLIGDATPHYFIFVIEDISERKKSEAKERAQKIALRETNQRMEEFLGAASHELRTPLTTIKANIQLALRRLKSLSGKTALDLEEIKDKVGAAQDMLTRAERQVGILNRLVGDMIDISRIQSGKLQVHLRPEPCNLCKIVQEMVQEQRKAVPGRSILLEMPAVEEVPVLADPDRIGQVLTNYMGNACKYSEAEITVYLASEGQSVRVSVRDEGPGLTSEELKHIWECFYQAPDVKVVSGSGVGLGLGLYISQTIIERHSGQVGVQSAPGKGSTFWFTLPIVQQDTGD